MNDSTTQPGLTVAQPEAGRHGVIHQVSVSNGGVPKNAVPEGEITRFGVRGDRQRDTRNHGGPQRAVCLFSLEVIERLRAEGHPIAPGTAGENVTISGLDWPRVVPGARLRLGDEVVLEVTRYTTPCTNIAASFSDGDSTRILDKRHPGESRVYASVLAPGRIRPGDPVELVQAANE
jgi:MOSC domain-containing protein YiiM